MIKQLIALSYIFVCSVYLQVEDQGKSKGKLINHENINIRSWSLTPCAIENSEFTLVRCVWTIICYYSNEPDLHTGN